MPVFSVIKYVPYVIFLLTGWCGFILFYRWENWATESLNDTPKSRHVVIFIHIRIWPIKKLYKAMGRQNLISGRLCPSLWLKKTQKTSMRFKLGASQTRSHD